jgi:DNA-binding MarR family transcriptional regulator
MFGNGRCDVRHTRVLPANAAGRVAGVSGDARKRVPRFTPDNRTGPNRQTWFCFTNGDVARTLLGDGALPVEATVVVDGYSLIREFSDVFDMADLSRSWRDADQNFGCPGISSNVLCPRSAAAGVDTVCDNIYIQVMNKDLRSEIKQTRPFASLTQEAYLSVGRTWARLEHEMGEALKPFGVTPTQYNVLRILKGAGPAGLCRSEIMERMIARVPDATRLLDRMEAAGLIVRARDAEDRRFVTTRITDEGVRLVAETEEPVMARHGTQFDGVTERDLRHLVKVLAQIRDAGRP